MCELKLCEPKLGETCVDEEKTIENKLSKILYFFFVENNEHRYEFVNLSIPVRSKIHAWCERNALYHWNIKDDNKSTLFLSNMSIHHETYARAAKDKRRESLHTRCNEQVNEIQSKTNDLKIKIIQQLILS